jgi:CRISPR-associated protein Csd1
MIKELCELGKSLRSRQKENEWIHNALKPEPNSIELIIAEDGSFQHFGLIEKKRTMAEAITAKKGKARLLLDKAEEVLGYGGEVSKKKHGYFLQKVDEYRQLPELAPVIAFYGGNKANGVEKALKEFEAAIPEEKNRKGNIGFRIQAEGYRIHEKPAVLREVIAKYEALQAQLLAVKQKKCAICGQGGYPVEDFPHGMIKKVPAGQRSGCALVSYNASAFESYALKGNDNSSICTNCAKTYVEGLNWLLSAGNEIVIKTNKGKEKSMFRFTNRKNFGSDTAMVFWTTRNRELSEIDVLEAPNPDDVARLIESVTSAKEQDTRYLEPDQFYSLTLSGSAARVAVRDWIETSLSDYRRSIGEWFKDIAIAEYDWDMKKLKTHYARLYDLARSCQRRNNNRSYDKDDASLARVATYLWNAALKNTLLP